MREDWRRAASAVFAAFCAAAFCSSPAWAQWVLDVEGRLYDAAISNREGGVLFGEGFPEGRLPELRAAEIAYDFASFNLGNIDRPDCGYKLCGSEAEAAASSAMKRLRPHLAALQEVFNPEQAARVLGPDYALVCDPDNGYECVAARRDVGTLEDAVFAPDAEGCDPGFNAMAVAVRFRDPGVPPVRIVNAHPDSRFPECRLAALKAIFESGDRSKLALGPRVLLAGDFNMDPFQGKEGDPSLDYWMERVGPGRYFHYLSPEMGNSKRPPTSMDGRSLDHVASNFAAGVCRVEKRLSINDHNAVACRLDLSPEAQSPASISRRFQLSLALNDPARALALATPGLFSFSLPDCDCGERETAEYRDKKEAVEKMMRGFADGACGSIEAQSMRWGDDDRRFETVFQGANPACAATVRFERSGSRWEMMGFEMDAPAPDPQGKSIE